MANVLTHNTCKMIYFKGTVKHIQNRYRYVFRQTITATWFPVDMRNVVGSFFINIDRKA